MGGIGSGRTVEMKDGRYLRILVDGDMNEKLRRVAELAADGSITQVVRVTLENYLDYAVDKLLEVK